MKNHYGPRFRILHWAMDQMITDALAKMDLTAAQGHILGYISHQQTPPCPRDIEEVFHLSHPTISGLLSRMEKKAFIEFRPDPADRRCKRIHLLPKGEQCMTALHEAIREIEQHVVEGFTPEEQAQFAALLSRAMDNLGANQCKSNQKEESNP